MSRVRQIQTGEYCSSEYATREDFCRVFTDDLDGLYQLSYLLTGDSRKAQECFVAGLEDSVKNNRVFREWARGWAKRAIIKNAIRALQPQPARTGSSLPEDSVAERRLRIIRDRHLEIDSVLALEDFERFVYVLTVLERYCDPESAALIGCSIEEIQAARIRALQEVANSACTDSSCEVPAKHGTAQLLLMVDTSLPAEKQPTKTTETPRPGWSRDRCA